MPVEKSDNTAKVPLLRHMTLHARAEYRPIADERYRQAHAGTAARMNYTLKQQEQARKEAERQARQGTISQGRGRSVYDQTILRQNEQRSKQMLEAERQAQAEAEAQALLTATLPTQAAGTVMRGVRNAVNGNEHPIADALATHGSNQGLFELSESTENWAKEHPHISGGVNLVGDFVLPTTLSMGARAIKPLTTRLAESMPTVGFQQGGLRIGNSVYRAPRLQLNVGVPLPERVPVISEYPINVRIKGLFGKELNKGGKTFTGFVTRDRGKTYAPMFNVVKDGKTISSLGEPITAKKLQNRIAKFERYVEPPKEIEDLKQLGLNFDESSWFRSRPKGYEATKEDITTFYGHVPEYKKITDDLMSSGQLFQKGKKWYGIIDGQTVEIRDPESFIVSHSKAFLNNGYVYQNANRLSAVRKEKADAFVSRSDSKDKSYPTWTTDNPQQAAEYARERNNGVIFNNLVGLEQGANIEQILPGTEHSSYVTGNTVGEYLLPVKSGHLNPVTGLPMEGNWRQFGPGVRVKSLRGNNGNFADDAGLFSFINIPNVLSTNINIV